MAATSSSSSSSAAAKAKTAAAAVPPPPPLETPSTAKKGFLRRTFPLLLAANLAVGVYVFARTYKRDSEKKEAEAAAAPAVEGSTAAAPEKPPEHIAAPVKVLPPISEDEQRQLYKWMLEEKRKIKSRNTAEKKKIDEEKALLKEFIRMESLPSL